MFLPVGRVIGDELVINGFDLLGDQRKRMSFVAYFAKGEPRQMYARAVFPRYAVQFHRPARLVNDHPQVAGVIARMQAAPGACPGGEWYLLLAIVTGED